MSQIIKPPLSRSCAQLTYLIVIELSYQAYITIHLHFIHGYHMSLWFIMSSNIYNNILFLCFAICIAVISELLSVLILYTVRIFSFRSVTLLLFFVLYTRTIALS